ncbi:hypothetical protein [Moorena sp. SIO3I6]|uniref:hypothetical protein n=1 Tax=Moorena sp. SIO3I6 TaxID=2607831 RepID=UPI0013FB46D2|nr:hypothetical protein [Moorena sp. SIO3I6]NEP22947.1 hypothetical protein [Moorena sp. SIO3I6]
MLLHQCPYWKSRNKAKESIRPGTPPKRVAGANPNRGFTPATLFAEYLAEQS